MPLTQEHVGSKKKIKNQYLYAHQSRITYHSLLWDTLYMIRNRSQKFWDIYQGYLLTFEQGVFDTVAWNELWKEGAYVK